MPVTVRPPLRVRLSTAAILLVGFAAFVFSPVPLCPSRVLLSVPCPGCGATRAFFAMLRGDFAQSWSLYPPLVPAVLVVVPSSLIVFLELVRRGEISTLPRALRVGWVLLVGIMVVVWLARFLGAFGGPAPL
jgi:hypothetical protein